MKVHLAYTDEPLKAGEDVSAVCGEIIGKAAFPFIFEGFPYLAHLNYMHICSKCYATDKRTWKYMYGLVNGQEAMTEVEA